MNRLLQKTFSSGGAEVFIYDQSSLWGVNTQNSIGRMSGFYNYPSTSSTTGGTASSYDAMGRTTFQRTWNWRSSGVGFLGTEEVAPVVGTPLAVGDCAVGAFAGGMTAEGVFVLSNFGDSVSEAKAVAQMIETVFS